MTEEALTEIHQLRHSQIPRHSHQSRHSRERGNPEIAEQLTIYGLSNERNGTLYADVTRN